MKLYLTRGFDGEKINFFGEFDDENKLNEAIFNFKNNCDNSYRFNPFETITFTENGKVIDFGDYEYFLKIENEVL